MAVVKSGKKITVRWNPMDQQHALRTDGLLGRVG
jgi:hypothetical protein